MKPDDVDKMSVLIHRLAYLAGAVLFWVGLFLVAVFFIAQVLLR